MIKTYLEKIGIFLILLSIIVYSFAPLLTTPVALAAPTTYSEDFTSLTSTDLTNTTADWNTRHGEITLPKSFQPSLLSQTTVADSANDILIEGTYAYVADGSSGLKIYDITDPENLSLIGSYDTANNSYLALTKTGNSIIIADSSTSDAIDMVIVNVLDPANPSLTKTMTDDDALGTPIDVGVSGTTLFALLEIHPSSAAVERIHSYDISDINNPAALGDVEVSQSGNLPTRGLQIVGDRLYAGIYTEGVAIIDISIPATPSLVSEYDPTNNGVQDLLISGSYMYLALRGTETNKFEIVDITDENNPTRVGSLNVEGGNLTSLSLDGTTMHVGTMTAGTVNINVSDPTNPEIMANQYQQPDMQQINSLWKDDNTLFAAGGTDGILALDYTAPLSPVQDWSIAPGATTVAFQMKAVSNKLYVANKGIFIYNITNAASPSLLGSNTTGCTEARSIEVSGNYAYVGCEGTGVRIYDISNPASPTSVATIATTGLKARGLKIVETTLYVATAGSGFRSYNISDPLNPSQIGSVSTPGGCYKIDVQGTTAFCGDNNSGVTAINISTPGSPSVISTYQPGGGTELNVQAEGNALFVSSLSEFFIIDISDTSSMSTLGSITPRDDVRGFGLSGNTLYISDSLRGMSVWDVTSRTTPIELGSMDFTDTDSTHGITDVYPLGKYFFATSYGTTSLFGASMTLQSSGVATSGAVDTTSDTIKHATLSITENKPTGTGITYQMSANGGTNWESVTPDVEHDFTNTGSDLRWQATLSTTDTTATPTISSLSIAYETYRVPNQPTITVTDDITQVQLASSTFSGDITHSSSDWEIYDSSTLSAGNLVAYSYNNASALTSIDMADGAFTFQNALSGRDRLRPNNNYWARVRHTNAQGSSSWSSTVSFTAQNQAPGSSTIPTQTWSEDTTETVLDQ